MVKKSRGKATVIKSGDVTTVRIVDYHGQPSPPPKEPVKLPPPPPDLETLKAIDIVGFNAVAERTFVKMLEQLCEKMPEGVPIVGLRAEAAFRLGISTETAKRYIEKWCYAFSAPFTVRDGSVFRKVQND
ncbi:MAG TPA: hypothetical protein PKW07_01670 [Syntrophorhabdaceae bacterium]|nr:hypothetical protein [Syntrophorhabdaceae bacterium]